MAKRGRPRDDSIKDFSVSTTPVKGVYLVRFWIGGKAFCIFVRHRAPWPKNTVLTLTPYQTFFEIAKTLLAEGAHSLSAETLAHRLTKKFREALKTLS